MGRPFIGSLDASPSETRTDGSIEKASASFFTIPMRGCDHPVSHWVTVDLATPILSASCSWVRSAFWRYAFMFWAMPMLHLRSRSVSCAARPFASDKMSFGSSPKWEQIFSTLAMLGLLVPLTHPETAAWETSTMRARVSWSIPSSERSARMLRAVWGHPSRISPSFTPKRAAMAWRVFIRGTALLFSH